jgi:hypothetical protein
MPYTLRKVRQKSCYRIINPKTKRVFAKCSTKQNAIKQLRLLRAIQYNKHFIPLSSAQRQTRRRRRTP